MTVLVQVSTENDDHFMSLEESVLKEIASRVKGMKPGTAPAELLKEMSRDFWKAASSEKVSRTSECDHGIVLDGIGDEESWGELLEQWAESPEEDES